MAGILLSTTYKGPWTRPLNWTLHATFNGEHRTPFSHYVYPEAVQASRAAFPQFRKLPTELQLRILYFCDSPTLFWLMQVSLATRTEAKALFWLSLDAWYYVSGDWLLTGGLPGHAHYATDFLAHVERIEVDLDDLGRICYDTQAGYRTGLPVLRS
jgi:hypothetical protein